jgi:hypothetical protein
MLSREFADCFAAEWIAAWNVHDVERVLTHYSDDFEMRSPYIAQLVGEPSGTLHGKAAVRDDWMSALARRPTLHFELVTTLLGADSLTLYYRGVRGMAAEVFFFDAQLCVVRTCAHYA